MAFTMKDVRDVKVARNVKDDLVYAVCILIGAGIAYATWAVFKSVAERMCP
jgi:hypothetical protein